MLNTSFRQVARSCPNASFSTRYTASSTSSRSTANFTTRCHQRRHSSSKPPIPPNNGSPSIPATSVKQVGAPRTSDKRAGAESRLSKRKVAKGEKVDISKPVSETKPNDWTLRLPSVPSTQHLHPKDVYVASFFSTHRPISITGPLPPETQIEDFDKIFQVRSKKAKNAASDVIYTLNSVVQNLDEHIQRGHQQSGQQQNEQQTVEQRADLIKALTQQNNTAADGSQSTHLDGQQLRGQGGNVKLMIQEIAQRFRPFHAPPPPVPAPDVDLLGERELDESQASPGTDRAASPKFELEIEQRNGEKIILQIHNVQRQQQQTTQHQPKSPRQSPNFKSGQFFTSQTVISDQPSSTTNSKADISEPSTQQQQQQQQPSPKGGRLKRGMYVDPRRQHLKNLRYHAISVKRQRKLKMKKHKYKKLMRKTRNLRRRQDRL